MENKAIKQEKEILKEKRRLINEELERKEKYVGEVSSKYISLSKELKGKYNVEVDATGKALNLAKKDIAKYEEAYSVPYFGRVDFREHKTIKVEEIYIGKHGISDSENGDEIVVDWRAPVADLYYSGTGGEASYKAPIGIIDGELSIKRKFLFDEEFELQRVFDEGINELMINGEEGQGLVDEFLKINLEESRGKKLKEVVATIQKEQNDIIRWPRNLPIIVQGSAGSGKTTIALHRLAYLIYRYKETMSGQDILVLAPNKLFLDYISDILPNLGAHEVSQSTFEDLVKKKAKLKGKIYNKDEKLKRLLEADESEKKLIVNSAKVRGSLTFKTMIDRYITLIEGRAFDIEDITIEGEVLFSRKEIMRLYLRDLKSYPINKRKDEIKRYLSLKVREKAESLILNFDMRWEEKIKKIKSETEDDLIKRRELLVQSYDKRDSIKEKIRKSSKSILNAYFKEWRGIDSSQVYENFMLDEELFKIATDGKVPEPLENFMRDEFIKRKEEGYIDEDDLAALLYIRVLLEGIEEEEKFKHIVVDEAQDYSPFQVYLVNQLAKGNSLTLVGDIAQGIYYYKGLKDWEVITDGLFKGNATYISLSQSYRSTVEIIDFAKGALEAQNLGLKDAKPVLRHGEKPQVIDCKTDKDVVKEIDDIIVKIKEAGKNMVAIITKDGKEAEVIEKLLKKNSKYKFQRIKGKEKETGEDLIIIPSYLTKGLEFDCSIIYNPSNERYKDNILDQRLLYVALTRALHSEYVIKRDELTVLINN